MLEEQQLEGQQPKEKQKLTISNLMESVSSSEKPGQDVVIGLSSNPRYLPPKYFYDQQGSQLFEQICELPEYYPTRTETAILRENGRAIAQATGPCEIVELGSGSSTKTRILLDAYQQAGYPLRYLPIDVSDTMLTETAEKLLQEYPQLSIHAIASTYEPALKALPKKQLPARMIAFLGSTIGNLLPEECDKFLASTSETLEAGDYFLLGIDLQKEISILEAAYDDSKGVTAAFNLNMLQHLNQRFRGNFDLENFSHVAKYNKQESQVEMYLESMMAQTVRLEDLDLTVAFEKGDRILSEISRKLNLQEMSSVLSRHKLTIVNNFTDTKQWFGLLLYQRVA
ncbi:L-histidine N(alpha)-methyltransferase [cf. Phormidesmis sp. LEGE 11477]|uniref:L-histidine N(alpha)-methyltransferase n=1 Tax=cf. Phormidesmis sp. LEGE 11477 TaxID=1828680 RepID=UPI0018828C36|nr:L-histidine N(alpha)-methyltransferase [cf. Phormidesmis sp. LEGE 11477]MBE9061342.1 L-histidine N(alpha)-methyltransferase [cf. Phormidesmis sp. LEGE 11477]